MRSVIKNFRNIKYGPAPEDDKEVLQWIKTLPNPNYNFISGKWIKPRGTKTIQAINPANKNKLSKVLSFKNLNFFIMKRANNNPITSITEIPKIPVSVKISR